VWLVARFITLVGTPQCGHAMRELTYCSGTYRRDEDGVWRYPWGDPVLGAADLTLAELMSIDGVGDAASLASRPLNEDERAWLAGTTADMENVLVVRHAGRPPNAGDLVIGMSAPELQVTTMLTVADIAELAGVSKATIDSYRYRGYLPEPQIVRGRTPLWARPIVRHWLETRPGSGWRTDIYHGNGSAPRMDVPA
jgi:predicted DNA-binding transcriptional regulator AlpA